MRPVDHAKRVVTHGVVEATSQPMIAGRCAERLGLLCWDPRKQFVATARAVQDILPRRVALEAVLVLVVGAVVAKE